MQRDRKDMANALSNELRTGSRPPPPPPPVAAVVQKTCMFWKQGRCTKGESCSHLHANLPNPSSGGSPKGGQPEGGGKGKDGNKGKQGDGSRERSPSRGSSDGPKGVCFAHNEGGCPRGTSCRYEHRKFTKEERESRNPRSPSPAAASQICQKFLTGKCNNPNCQLEHPGGFD